MRSLPTPRYSRRTTSPRTRIRQSRITKQATSRPKLVSHICNRLIQEVLIGDGGTDEGRSSLINTVVRNGERNSWGLGEWFNLFSFYKKTTTPAPSVNKRGFERTKSSYSKGTGVNGTKVNLSFNL
ncbi:unnamed protein product [Ambrosiozyma monospora]|uniref:Unnamed protein product n=1 Tax=Ambrosiozyma monospora TaxID=43982 RepID=A0A9W6YXW7_AMBMO|nr:unnamed protein product [Ambrosiozyma monospora]